MSKPVFENAPGIVFKPRTEGKWEVRWCARTDLVARGYTPKSARLWCGLEPTDLERAYVADRANTLQNEMLIWGRGSLPAAPVTFDGTLGTLIGCYQTNPLSSYHKLRYRTRRAHEFMLRRLDREIGKTRLADVKAPTLIGWHEGWTGAEGHLWMAHGMIAQIRTLVGFGTAFLEDGECARLCVVLRKMRFSLPARNFVRMTADQADAIRAEAHRKGWHSMALAQALQFDGMFRQKDVLGEWVPNTEPGISDVVYGNEKWLRGIRWDKIDSDLVLKHVTSKRQKLVEIDLKLAPMIVDELMGLYPGAIAMVDDKLVVNRSLLPASGPMIIMESTGFPYLDVIFRRKFDILRKAAGIPDNVKNMHSRAGAITEATEAGAALEHVQQMAAHSDIKTTQGYSRGQAEKTVIVMQQRAAYRNKSRKD